MSIPNQNSGNQINANAATIKAEGNVEIVGNDRYNVAGNIINVQVDKPSYGADIEHLQKSLKRNREDLEEDINRLEVLVHKELDLKGGEIQAVIKDIITSSRNIEVLIPAIRLNGGKARSLPNESNTLLTINTAIIRGQQDLRKRRVEFLKVEQKKKEKLLKKAKRFKFFRFKKQKEKDIKNAQFELDKVKFELEYTEDFLEKTKDI